MVSRRLLLVALAAASISGVMAAPALADRKGGRLRGEDDGDDEDSEEDYEDNERRALQSAVDGGLILPLAEVLARIKDRLPGRVVAVEIEREGSRWVYEFKAVDVRGRRREVYVDAASAEILEVD